MKKVALFLTFIAFSLSCFFIAGQTSSTQLKQNKKKLESEIKKTQQLLDENRKNQKASMAQVAMLRNQISNREGLLATLNDEVTELEAELADTENESAELEKKLAYLKEDYATVVYNAYRNRKLGNRVIFILSSDNFREMVRRVRYYQDFSQGVRRLLATIESTLSDISKKKEEIEQIKNEKTSAVTNQTHQLQSLENEKREKDRLTSNLKKKEKQLAAEIRKKQKEQKRLDAAIQQAIQKEIAAANAKNKKESTPPKKSNSNSSAGNRTTTSNSHALSLTPAEQQLNSTFVSNKGKLPWPLAKCSKIRGFGSYTLPDMPTVSFYNNGIDLLTEAGASVRAVFQGEVTTVTEVDGVKIIIIRHGEYLTVYQNLASISVSKGQKVSTKQTIGTVAKNRDTGTYVLRFSLLKLQQYLDPTPWLAH